MLKKVYIEITNTCNLNCDFCIQNKRIRSVMSEDNFRRILVELKGYTKYLYFHILGEPLLHPNIINFINIASTEGFFVNITTNGYLIGKLENVNILRQLNISLHSYDERYNISLDKYMDSIFEVVDNFKDTYVSYRLWVDNIYTERILKILNEHYNTNIKLEDIDNNITLKENIFISQFHEFIWPDLDNNYYSEEGTCYALRDHIGILVDGTVVPCCLDTKGDINLGNIFNDNIDNILNSERVLKMKDGFKNHKKCEELCRHCSFIKT